MRLGSIRRDRGGERVREADISRARRPLRAQPARRQPHILHPHFSVVNQNHVRPSARPTVLCGSWSEWNEFPLSLSHATTSELNPLLLLSLPDPQPGRTDRAKNRSCQRSAGSAVGRGGGRKEGAEGGEARSQSDGRKRDRLIINRAWARRATGARGELLSSSLVGYCHRRRLRLHGSSGVG